MKNGSDAMQNCESTASQCLQQSVCHWISSAYILVHFFARQCQAEVKSTHWIMSVQYLGCFGLCTSPSHFYALFGFHQVTYLTTYLLVSLSLSLPCHSLLAHTFSVSVWLRQHQVQPSCSFKVQVIGQLASPQHTLHASSLIISLSSPPFPSPFSFISSFLFDHTPFLTGYPPLPTQTHTL